MSRPPFGRTVPANDWTPLLDGGSRPHGLSVSVVVTHFEQPTALARALAALARQTTPPDEVVVTDDGSAESPVVPSGVRLVRQGDHGFRAAAARNKGAGATTGDLLVFLDADTTPEPDFVERLTQLPSVLPELLAVGRRRHAAYAGDERVRELPDPAWLADAYARTADLRDADETSFRFVLSSVLACSRWWFDRLGGFDATFTAYGGEDWELAHRSWCWGGLVAHVPDAVAWHDGPDAGLLARAGSDETVETLAVADRVGVPGAAYRGLLQGPADLVVTADPGIDRRDLTLSLDGLLAARPTSRVLLVPEQAAWFARDPRIVAAEWPRPPRDARLHLHLREGLVGPPAAWDELTRTLDGQCALGEVRFPVRGWVAATLHDLRLHRRASRWNWPEIVVSQDRRTALRPAGGTSLEAWFGGW